MRKVIERGHSDVVARRSSLMQYETETVHRVKCRHGCELDAILYLLQLADPTRHNIHNTFTLNGTGYIYIEGSMDMQVQQLVRLVPGLLFSSVRSYLDNIPVGHLIYDQVPLLLHYLGHLPASPMRPGSGSRMRHRPQPLIDGLKRKRSHRPSLQLFNPYVVEAAFNISPVPKGNHIWSFKGSIFDHGLLRKKIKPGSALPDVLVPGDVGILFMLTKHPLC
ncbi:hypothetical protein M378DRAFT_17526 [Amanita muscaria Koide BX008]|uniref:Uncharacterized protein n=1 Tax=Amanita muscaria (strain Koide BX008) TaxID=946122 RepID=A0A0C2WIE1_AMAMK|nr:hypothetical protein M378DRAFT_17526 [Amanita muscaria Koide BX008]